MSNITVEHIANEILSSMEKEASFTATGTVLGGLIGAASKSKKKNGEETTTGQRAARGALKGGAIGLGLDAATLAYLAHKANKVLKVASNEELTVEKIAQEVVVESISDQILNSMK